MKAIYTSFLFICCISLSLNGMWLAGQFNETESEGYFPPTTRRKPVTFPPTCSEVNPPSGHVPLSEEEKSGVDLSTASTFKVLKIANSDQK